MFKSIRWSLQIWHAGLLAAVLAGFGGATYYGVSSMRYAAVDADLKTSVQTLAAGLHIMPGPPNWDRAPGGGSGNDGGRGGWDGGRRGGGGGGQDFDPNQPRRNGSDWGMGGPPPGGWPGGGGGPGGPGGPGGGPPDWKGASVNLDVAPDFLRQFGGGGAGTMYYAIWGGDDSLLQSSELPSGVSTPTAPPAASGNFQGPPRVTAPQVRRMGDIHEAYVLGPFGSRVAVGASIAGQRAELHTLALWLGAVGAGIMSLGLFGGWLLSRRVIRPIEKITAAAQEISAHNLGKKIDVAETQSELGTLAAVLNDAFGRLESAFGQQVRFTADASHELRTPLAVIHTHAQLALSRDRSAEEYKKTLETCLRASNRMKGLVDSLLVLAKADAGRLAMEKQAFDLCDIAGECVSMVTPLAEERRIKLETDLKSTEITADSSRIAQVIINLLSNAIRYNRANGTVRVTVESRPPLNDAYIVIADTGMGIPEENQPHLFERFYRVDAARSREMGGSGLGLAICKSIVEAHGGSITFHSELDVGTTFTVRIPRGAA